MAKSAPHNTSKNSAPPRSGSGVRSSRSTTSKAAVKADPAVEWPIEGEEKAQNQPSASQETKSPPVLAQPSDPISVTSASLKKGETVMTDAMETVKTYAEEAKTRFQSVFTEMNDKAKAAMEKSSKAFEEMGELTKGNLEAVVESGKIAAKGVESLGQEAAELGRKSFEKTSATMKSFASVKSPAEFFQLQSELLSSTIDTFASEAAKSSETMLKLAGEIAQPISNRVSIVSDKIKSLAA